MLQTSPIPGLWDLLCFWLFTGSNLLGLPPGELDPALVRAVPPQSLVYFEWAARGPGQPGATGIDGFAADPEIQNFLRELDSTLARLERRDSGPRAKTHREMLQLVNPLTKHPGCLFIGFEPQVQNNNPLLAWADILKGLRGGMIFSTGPDTDVAWQKLLSVLADAKGMSFDPAVMTHPIPIAIPGYELVAHREGGRIIFAFGQGTLQRTLDGLTSKVAGLDSNPRFRESINRVGVPRVSTVGWLDSKGLIDSITTAMGPLGGLIRPVLQATRIDSIDRAAFMSGVDNGTMVQRTFINTGGRTDGVLAFLAGQPIHADQYAHIPADADMVFTTSASLSNVFQEARRTLAAAQPLAVRVFDEAIKQIEKELQLKIVDDVLPAFGDIITVFDSPAAGGLLATSLIATVEIRDPQRAAVVFDRIVRMVDQSASTSSTGGPNELSVMHKHEFMGYSFFTASSNPLEGLKPRAPTLCLTDRHLIIAIHPQALKAELRHLRSNAASFVPRNPGGNPAPQGDVMTFGYLNGPRALSLAAAIMPFIGQDVFGRLQQQGFPLDAASIPSSAAVLPYFGDATIVTTRQADGVSIVTKNAPPLIATAGLLSAYRGWKDANHDEMTVPSQGGSDEVQLGPAEGETRPASFQQPAAATKPAETPPNPSTYRKIAPIFLKALVPDEYQHLIPDEAIKRLENGPTETQLQRREENRKRREELRARRRGQPIPAPSPAPSPNQP